MAGATSFAPQKRQTVGGYGNRIKAADYHVSRFSFYIDQLCCNPKNHTYNSIGKP
jgi:hypothetical protein